MSQRDSDAREEKLAQGIPFFGQQLLKKVRTAEPGIVLSYDSETQRARVQPAIHLRLKRDGKRWSVPKPVILDVPVLHPAGGGFLVHVPLRTGDAVMLLFSARDMAAFKQSLRSGAPPSPDIMALKDAVAIPGFAPANAAPRTGLTMQTTDGNTFINLTDGQVTIKAARITLQHGGGTEVWP